MPPAITPRTDFIAQAIEEGIQKHIQIEVDKAVAEAQKKIAQRIPEIVSALSIQVMRHVSMKWTGEELLITVVYPKKWEVA